jgi:hypothetical protein
MQSVSFIIYIKVTTNLLGNIAMGVDQPYMHKLSY